uniref:E3 ubiquitin-protein ligase RBBP6-like isoform X2 n=1 Tax=Scatophagus argus TaxID=75038 RepID=UPI001ED84783|nr:E3 ubiquitin-protein ligase RBBP6-like isoform X2 [Scatophagus argus]
MTHIHYKFSSKLSSDTVVFAGPQITLRDLKKEIMEREKLRSGDCDLQITNAQTKEEYTEDEGLIPRGSSVIVRRIPIVGVKSGSSSKTRNTVRSDSRHQHASGAIKAMDDRSSSRALPLFSELANLAVSGVSEEDKIKALTNQSPYNCMNYNKKSGAVPVNYICYGCGNPGHHIRNCPTSGVRAEHQDKNVEAPPRLKKSTGIPLSKLEVVDDPNREGVMLTNSGLYVIPAIHVEYSISKKEKPTSLPEEQPGSEDMEDPVPNELLCLICRNLLNDAVVIPCCGNSYCDDCIRTALLDSDDHICPTCQQPEVSPDTLIANKFIRQAVNNFEKEQGHGKGLKARLATSQSQNPTQMPSPVPTPPPQPQRPHLSSHKSSQQDPLLRRSQSADTPSSSQEFWAPPTATVPAPACRTPSTSLQPLRSQLAIPDTEAEEKAPNEPPAAPPSVLISHEDSTAAATLVNHTPVSEQPKTVSVNRQQPSSGPTPLHPVPLTYWNSSSSTSGCPAAAWSESDTHQLPPSSCSSSYPAAPPPPPPLFPSPSFLTAQQPLSSYPPGYPPATHVWTLQTPQSSTIPSLCPSTATSAIPTLIANEWYMHQRKKSDRSPHRGSTYRRSSSRSNSKSSKSKSSRSYSRSSSRSRSRSRSQGRSRPHSPYSRHRDLDTRSRSSQSYSYGYKRSPSLSSSSSPRVGYRSRSKSPSDHRKHSHHSRHHSKKFSSSRYSSRKRGENSRSEAGVSEKSLASSLCAQQAKPADSLELSRQQYLQWKSEYKEWCDKYFNSYLSHFHQLLPTAPFPQLGDREEGRHHSHANRETLDHLRGRRSAQVDGHSPPSQSSSDSCSTPSQSSSDSRSTPSSSSSDSRSSPSHSSNGSRSPPSQSSSDGRSTPSKDGAQLREYQRRCAEKHGHVPVPLTKVSKGAELQERRKDKQLITKKPKNLSTLKHEQKSMKKHKERRAEKCSSPDAADSTDAYRKDMSRGSTEPNSYKDGTPVQGKATACEALESGQSLVKPDKCLDKDYERKRREQDNLELEKGLRRAKYSDSRQDVERQHKEKHSKGAGKVDTDTYRNPGGSKDSDSRSEKTEKRKGEDTERGSVEAESSKCFKANMTEGPETHKVEFPDPFDRKEPYAKKKKDSKTCPLTEGNIWEGGIKVKPQKKISININLHGKQKEEKFEKTNLPYLESMTEKTKDETEKTGNGEEEMLSRGGTEVNEQKESRRDQEGESKDKLKPDEREARQPQEKAAFKDDKRQMSEKTAREKEHREEEDSELWHCALRGAKDKEGAKQWEEQQGAKAGDDEELTNDERRNVMGGEEEERRVRNEGGGQEMGRLVTGTQKEWAESENTCRKHRGNTPVESKPKEELMEEVKLEMRRDEDMTRSKLQTSMDDGSSYEDYQERKLVVKTPEKYTQARAADRKDELALIQVPRSKWDKEEEQNEGKVKVQTDALVVPSSSVSVTAERPISRETEREDELKRHGETDRDRAKAMERGRDREREKNSTVSTSEKSMAPPSGKQRHDSALSAERDRERERRMEGERPRDRERGRESERQRERQKERKRSKERTREEERRRDRERRERERGSKASVQMRNSPSPSSHSYSSHDAERRDRQRGDNQGSTRSSCCPHEKSSSGRSWESSTMSRAAEPPDQNRDILDHSHHYHSLQDPSVNYRHQERPAGTHSQGTERDPPPSEFSGASELSKPRMSRPGQEFIQNRSRNESKVEKEEREQKMVAKVIKEGKGERDYQGRVAERKRGGHWENEDDKLDRKTTWVGRREQEEGARHSSSRKSVSPSSSQESSGDDTRKEWKKKQQKHKKEKRQAARELLEEEEMKNHKKSRQCRDGESSGEGDDAKLCSAMFL